MPLILYPGTDMYSTITVSGLYDNNTESPLFAPSGSTAPTSGIAIGGQDATGTFNLLAQDQSGNALTFPGIQFKTGTPIWDVTTVAGTHQYNTGTATELTTLSGAPAYVITLDQSAGTFTTGAVTFEGTYDNVNWVTIPTMQVVDPNTFTPQSNPYTLVTATNKSFLILSQGYAQVRLTLSTALTALDTGTVTTYWSTLAYEPTITSATSSVVSGSKSNNTVVPGSTNLGVLGAIAESTYTTLTYTDGFQVLPATDVHGALWSDMAAVAGVAIGSTSVVNFGSSPAAAPVQAVNSSIFSGTTSITNTGGALNVNITNATPVSVAGNLSNDTAAPIADNLGVLGFIAETAYNTVTYTTGNQVLAVTDLHGAINNDMQAVAGVQLGATSVTAFGTAPAAVNVQAVNSSIFAGTTALTATGSSLNVNITNATPISVSGNLTNNNAAPIADNLGVLGAIAVSGAFPAVTIQAATAGFQELLTVSQGGSLISIPADEEYASHIGYFSVDTGNTLKTVPTATIYPLISVRSSSAAFQYLVREVQGFTDGSQEIFQLLKNPTLTGATFAATAPTGSHVTVDTAATVVTSVGTVVWSGFASTNPVMKDALLAALAAGAPGDTYTMACQKFGTGTSKAGAQIFWSEVGAAI